MAKAPKVDTALLQKIADANAANSSIYLSQTEGQPLVSAGFIETNMAMTDPNDGTRVAVRVTPAGTQMLASSANRAKDEAFNKEQPKHKYDIITGVVLPEAKRRGNFAAGTPKYPFAELPVGGSFFSANTEHAKGDALKALGSTVSAQNNKYSKPTGEMKSVKQAVRDPNTRKAVIGPDGKKETHVVQLPVKTYERKFTIRAVKSGETYGSWTAPADGAVIARTV